jgi:hypothetical protein
MTKPAMERTDPVLRLPAAAKPTGGLAGHRLSLRTPRRRLFRMMPDARPELPSTGRHNALYIAFHGRCQYVRLLYLPGATPPYSRKGVRQSRSKARVPIIIAGCWWVFVAASCRQMASGNLC